VDEIVLAIYRRKLVKNIGLKESGWTMRRRRETPKCRWGGYLEGGYLLVGIWWVFAPYPSQRSMEVLSQKY